MKLGIVELERDVVSGVVGTLGPSSPDLGTADEDAVAGGIVVGLLASEWAVLFLRYSVFFFAWRFGSLVQDLSRQPRLLPRMLFGAATTASLWLIWPEDGCASIA